MTSTCSPPPRPPPSISSRPTPIATPSLSNSNSQQAAKKQSSSAAATAATAAAGDNQDDQDKLVLTNQLSLSRSPYVRAHANNPVKWQLWNDQTLVLAKQYNRVMFVSIGYAACHWCHVMERESFENEEVAKILNENFVPIKIDREERPDIDRIYMNFVQATTGSGGWPLNVFLTPNLQPVFGGTYWPGPNTTTRGNDQALGFLEVLEKIVNVWKEQQERCIASAKEILIQLKDFTDEGLKGSGGEPEEGLELDLLEEACQHFVARYDPVYGGFGTAPKFPTPVNLAFLLRLGTFPSTVQDVVGEMECEHAQTMAITTLKHMAKGGIHDHIGHGFSRYSVTADWSLPHFEKMLYDQAQLLAVYLDAYLTTKDHEMLDVVYDVADYLCDSALKNPQGGFFSSEDADSLYRKADTEKREGAFYVWTRKELDMILGDQEASVCARYWNVHRDGNVDPAQDAHDEFIAQNVLSIVSTTEKLSQMYGMNEARIINIIRESKQKLRQHREKERPRPNLDDKIVTSWNGLTIGALARVAAVLADISADRSNRYRKHAEEAVAFIRKQLYEEGTGVLMRVYKDGPGETPGFADDYAFLIWGLLCLYETTFDIDYLQWADTLQKKQIDLFWDKENGGFFSTSTDSPDLILRLKDGLDSQEPSTNGISATNLFRLSTLLGDPLLSTLAQKTTLAFSPELLEHPFLFASLMPSIVASNLGMHSVVLAGNVNDPKISTQLRKLRSRLLTNTTIVLLDPDSGGGGGGGDRGGGGGGGGSLEWLLRRNGLYREVLERVEESGGEVVEEVCGGKECLDGFGMSDVESTLKELLGVEC